MFAKFIQKPLIRSLKKIKKKEKKLNFGHCTSLYVCFLKFIGILPFDGSNPTLLGSLILIVSHCLNTFILWSIFLFYFIKKDVITADVFCEMALALGASIRYYILISKRSEFQQLLKESKKLWHQCSEDGHRQVFKFERKMRKLFLFILGTSNFINVIYPAAALIVQKSPVHCNETDHRVLPYKWFVDNAEQYWPGYGVTFVIQMLIVQMAFTMASTVDSAAPLLIMLGCGYLRNLRTQLVLASRTNQFRSLWRKADQELIHCFKFHQDIIEFCRKINKLTRILFLVQIVCTGYSVSLIGIKLAGSDPDKFKYISLLGLSLGQLLICEWASDHLAEESESVARTVFAVSFTWMNRQMGKDLIIMIRRAQRPIQMTACNIIRLSLENFNSMLMNAYSFFTVLRNLSA